MKLKQHPLSAAFPAMQADEYQSLVDSIGEIGVQNPITIYEGMVIDGWHRYSAANEVGQACPTVELGDVDPRDFVLAQNKARRNLSASQRAAAVTSVYQWAPSHREKKVEPGSTLSKTNAELAVIAGVSTKTIQQAKAAQKAGLGGAVKDGAMTAKEAAKVASGKTDKPKKPVLEVPAQDDEGAPDEQEFNSVAAAEKADAAAMNLLLASDAPLAEVTEKYKQSLLMIERLNSRIVGLQNQSLHQISEIKRLKKKLDRMEQPA